jgi:hypothetical protein
LKKVAWVVEDMFGGIDALMPERPELDSSHLEAVLAGIQPV